MFENATSAEERDAAAAALDRIRTALSATEQTDQTTYAAGTGSSRIGMRASTLTVVLRAPITFINHILWVGSNGQARVAEFAIRAELHGVRAGAVEMAVHFNPTRKDGVAGLSFCNRSGV